MLQLYHHILSRTSWKSLGLKAGREGHVGLKPKNEKGDRRRDVKIGCLTSILPHTHKVHTPLSPTPYLREAPSSSQY